MKVPKRYFKTAKNPILFFQWFQILKIQKMCAVFYNIHFWFIKLLRVHINFSACFEFHVHRVQDFSFHIHEFMDITNLDS